MLSGVKWKPVLNHNVKYGLGVGVRRRSSLGIVEWRRKVVWLRWSEEGS